MINKNKMKVLEKIKSALEKIPENDNFWKNRELQKAKTLNEIEEMLKWWSKNKNII